MVSKIQTYGHNRLAQRGAVSVITVTLLAIVVMLVLVTAMKISNSGVNDTLNQSDSVQALFVAESGLERVSWNYGDSGVCDASLAEGPISLGADSFTVENIGADFNLDFAGAALPADQCHVKITSVVSRSNTKRTLEAILERSDNLLISANPDFNDPPGSGPPTGWTFSQAGAFSGDPWDDTGGPDGSRAAFVYKPNNGGGAAVGGGSFALSSFTVTAPITLDMSFEYSVENGNSLNTMQLSFTLSDGTNSYVSAVYEDRNTGGVFKSGSVTIAITGSGSVDISSLSFSLTAKAGQRNRIWLDNLLLSGGSAAGTPVNITQWRETVL